MSNILCTYVLVLEYQQNVKSLCQTTEESTNEKENKALLMYGSNILSNQAKVKPSWVKSLLVPITYELTLLHGILH